MEWNSDNLYPISQNTRDRLIYGYLGFTDISVSAKMVVLLALVGVDKCYIPHTSRQLVLESTTNQVKIVILQQC